MKQVIRRSALSAMSVAILAGVALSMPGAIAAKDGDVIRTGDCSARSDWKLKLGTDNGRIEVEFEVDQNRNGETWNVVLKKNGTTFWSGQRTTQAPSGSFAVHKLVNDGPGTDAITGKATNPRTGEVCRGSASI
jgi:hypothetical protein